MQAGGALDPATAEALNGALREPMEAPTEA
jgi:hypothetical protein